MTAAETPALFPVPDEPGDGGQAAALLAIADLDGRVTGLEQLLIDEPDTIGYRATPPPQLWAMGEDAYGALVAGLTGWVTTVYVPTFGHLSARLRTCWANHPLCVYLLDVLSELHRVLYLRSNRPASVLSGQAELYLRLAPAAADMMHAEQSACHSGHVDRSTP